MNIEGRIRLFTDKFGLRNDNVLFAETITGLFQDALTSIEDEDFLQQSAVTIREAGWLRTLYGYFHSGANAARKP